MPAPALVETYAVLTRLPPPHRLTAKDAWALIEGNFVTGALLEELDADVYVDLLRRTASQDVAGGEPTTRSSARVHAKPVRRSC